MQTIVGLVLDFKSKRASKPTLVDKDAVQVVLNTFLCLNFVQMAGVRWLRRQHMYGRQMASMSDGYRQVASSYEEGDEEQHGLHGEDHAHMSLLASPESTDSETQPVEDMVHDDQTSSEGERRRGRIFVMLSGGVIFGTWMLFIVSAWVELSSGG